MMLLRVGAADGLPAGSALPLVGCAPLEEPPDETPLDFGSYLVGWLPLEDRPDAGGMGFGVSLVGSVTERSADSVLDFAARLGRAEDLVGVTFDSLLVQHESPGPDRVCCTKERANDQVEYGRVGPSSTSRASTTASARPAHPRLPGKREDADRTSTSGGAIRAVGVGAEF